MSKAVVLFSGGLDSTTLLYRMRKDHEVIALSFDYGQRHDKELAAAAGIAKLASIEHHIIALGVYNLDDIAPLASLLPGSALTDSSVPVPDGHYADETMKQTIVPNRNAIMLSIAYGVAVARGAELVAFAAHAGDHAIYPDCRPAFVGLLNAALREGNAWANPIPWIKGPFLNWDKKEIAREAAQLQIPISYTWSCYKGGDIHCGTCGTCVERKEAFQLAGINDPTPYEN